MTAFPRIDVLAPTNADGYWVRDVSQVIAADPEAATADWRTQVRSKAGDRIVVLDMSSDDGSLSLVGSVLIHAVPLAAMRRVEPATYAWDGVYTTASGRTVKWFEGDFIAHAGVTVT